MMAALEGGKKKPEKKTKRKHWQSKTKNTHTGNWMIFYNDFLLNPQRLLAIDHYWSLLKKKKTI